MRRAHYRPASVWIPYNANWKKIWKMKLPALQSGAREYVTKAFRPKDFSEIKNEINLSTTREINLDTDKQGRSLSQRDIHLPLRRGEFLI